MSLIDLTDREIATVRQSLAAAARGQFFPDWEFQTLIGWSRHSVSAIATSWPAGTPTDQDAIDVAVSVIGNLVSYPHGCMSIWARFIDVTPLELDRLADKLLLPSDRDVRDLSTT